MNKVINVSTVDANNNVFELIDNSDFELLLESTICSKFINGKLDISKYNQEKHKIVCNGLSYAEYYPLSLDIYNSGAIFNFDDFSAICKCSKASEFLIDGNSVLVNDYLIEISGTNIIDIRLYLLTSSLSKTYTNEKVKATFTLQNGDNKYLFEHDAVLSGSDNDYWLVAVDRLEISRI